MPFPTTPYLNIYFVCGDELALIDTGIGDKTSVEAICQQLEGFGELGLIINTHEHIDHFGGNARLKEITNARIVAHKIAATIIENPELSLNGRLSAYQRSISDIMPSKVDVYVDDGEVIDLGSVKLRVIHTPGHSPGHISLYDDEGGILFSGDNVTDTATTYVGSGSLGNMTDYINSLTRLLDLELRLILPAHGGIIKNPYEKIRESIDHKLSRKKEILALLGTGEKTVDELISAIYRVRYPYLLRGAMLGYLENLEQEEKIISIRRNYKYRIK
jgi:glyoxylase-like metal-dependent hydrolase (beta-lactamase superfamily II)